jgi:hypothetical protein
MVAAELFGECAIRCNAEEDDWLWIEGDRCIDALILLGTLECGVTMPSCLGDLYWIGIDGDCLKSSSERRVFVAVNRASKPGILLSSTTTLIDVDLTLARALELVFSLGTMISSLGRSLNPNQPHIQKMYI